MSEATNTAAPTSQQRRRKMTMQLVWVTALIFPISVGVGFVSGYLENREGLPEPLAALGAVMNSPWFLVLFFGAVMTWSLVATFAYWTAIDELAREAHKRAWFWGGSAGMAVAASLLMTATVMEPFASFSFDGISHMQLLLWGGYGMFSVGLLGYLIAWAIFWWRAR